MFLSLDRLYFLQYALFGIHCHQFLAPQFESDWLPIMAQSLASELSVPHGLGAVPGMVEVYVKAVDGENEGFIFKAMGNGGRDDDSNDMYGGVIYIYNDVSVRVMAPYGLNHNTRGAAIYTGEAPYWHGVNSQSSLTAEVKVRCWSVTSLPEPCMNMTDIYMKAGSSIVDNTYKELSHNQGEYPSLVKVRVRMTDGLEPGWYSDAQGASMHNYDTITPKSLTGGLKFAYSDTTVRVWTSSYPAPGGVIFARHDGWGTDLVYKALTTEGYVEVFAWCDLVLAYQNKIPFGPLEADEDLQIPIPVIYASEDDFFISVLVEAADGPNKGYLFEGVGSAMPNTVNIGQPCAYGGLVYAYNDTTLRIWRPDHATGAAICIPDSMGFGTNSQASQNGNLLFRVYSQSRTNPADIYLPPSLVCSHFTLLGNNTAYRSTPIDTQHNVTTLLACNHSCRRRDTCVTYSYNNNTCQMYNTTSDSLLYKKNNSQVWGRKK